MGGINPTSFSEPDGRASGLLEGTFIHTYLGRSPMNCLPNTPVPPVLVNLIANLDTLSPRCMYEYNIFPNCSR